MDGDRVGAVSREPEDGPAKSWDEFRDACAYSRIPSENMVWADRQGNIGYQAVGIAPLRPNWSGLIPVPGDGRYEWNGYLPIKALPHLFDPAKGFIATTNNYLFPPDYAYPEAMHFTWADPFRASRITELLGAGRLESVPDMIRIQNDVVSIPARELTPLLRDLPIPDAAVARARDLLVGWNDSLDPDSVPAGIYEMWLRRLQTNVRDLLVPKEARPFIGNMNLKKMIDTLNAPDGRFGADAAAGRDALLVRCLTEAVAELTKRFGADVNGWRWGQNRYHHALIHHMLGGVVAPEFASKLNVGPYPRGGDSYTINATGGSDNQPSGGSFKIITDTEDWDHSLGLNNPGQSGDPDNPHYRDLFELWARGKYFPIFYTRAKVESVTEERLTLTPAR